MVAISHRARVPKEREGAGRQSHTQARLTSAGAACAALLLVLLAGGILRSPGSLEERVLDAVQSLGLTGVEPAMVAMRTLTALPWALAIWGAVVVAFALGRRWSLAVPVLLVPLFVGMAQFVLGGLVGHVGPALTEVERAAADPAGTSFPSGQVVAVVLFGGLLAAAAVRSGSPVLRFGACGSAVLAAGLIGLAELWYGDHWPTDVLAGYAFGGLVLAFFVTLERWFAPAVDGHSPRAAIRGAKERFADGEGKASAWLESAVARWQQEGRLTEAEASTLRALIEAPSFQAVLPHLGVHLTIGVALRFPFGSIVRGTYVLANMLFATGRFLAHRLDRRRWRADLSIHSPLVLLVTCLPGFGTFAYLLSKPVRSNHLLLRVVLDSVLRKAPARLYAGTGLARTIARPAGWAATKDAVTIQAPTGHEAQDGRFLAIALPTPRTVAKALGTLAATLFAADLVMQTIDDRLHPTFLGWEQTLRILDLNSETSFGTWFSVVGLLVASALFGIIAYAARRNGDRFQYHWWFLALVFLGFSIDEQAKLHDAGGNAGNVWRDTFGTGGVLYYGWVILALGSIVVMAIIYRHFIFALPARIRALSFLAAALYVGGEVGVEMITGWLMDNRGEGLVYDTFTSIEEFLGIAGVVVAISNLLLYVQEHVGEFRVRVEGAGSRATGPEALAHPKLELLNPEIAISAAVQPLVVVHEVRHERSLN